MFACAARLVALLALLVSLILGVGIASAQTPSSATPELEAIAETQIRILQRLDEMTAVLKALRANDAARSSALPSRQPSPTPTDPIDFRETHTKGAKDAPVAIIEFGDFQCPYCATFARTIMPELTDKYIAPGRVAFGFWHLPLVQIHPFALRAADAAECADLEGLFWPMHDALFADQAHLDEESLNERAVHLGLDMAKFSACMSAPNNDRIRDSAIHAMSILGNAVTPSFLIGRLQNGMMLQITQRVDGVQPVKIFEQALDSLLGKSPE
jgi:protein-disulfide isomerase